MMTSPSTSVSSASDDEMKDRVVSYLNDYDILNGRGKDINNLAGNITFQRLIAGNKDRYKECKESEKKNISKDIVDAVRGNGGQFLKYDKSNKIYVDIGDKKASAKTSQAFRDALKKEKEESVPPVGNHAGFFLSNQSGRTTSADLSFSLGPNFVGDALAGVPVRKTSARNEVRLAGTTSSSSAHTSTTPAVPSSSVMPASASVSGVVSKKDTKKKSTKASVTKKKKAEASYKFKDNVDHAFLIDAKSIPNILSKDHKLDLNLGEEQRILLYGDQQQREKMRVITDAAVDALSAGAVDGALSEAGILQLPWELPAVHEGWGERNLLSVRTVWAKVRLPESELQQIDKLQQGKSIESEANTHSGSTSSRIVSTHIEARAPTRLEDDITNHVWHNEARAEQDPTLALLSEATEMYLKEAIETAVGKARHRQNLDGVRLWHTLHSHHADPNSTSGKPPPALIRLGCDVRRQLALADGNAVKTYQRMEEAIVRNNDTFHFEAGDPEKMILEATSMADLSRQPPLKTAVSDADSEAKRRFEVFAGKVQEPPFGRVPKKAKVILTDLSLEAVRNNQTPAIRVRRRQLLGGW